MFLAEALAPSSFIVPCMILGSIHSEVLFFYHLPLWFLTRLLENISFLLPEQSSQLVFHLARVLFTSQSQYLLAWAVDALSIKLSQEMCGFLMYFTPCIKSHDQLTRNYLDTSQFCKTTTLIFLGTLLPNWEDILGITLMVLVLLIKCIKALSVLKLDLVLDYVLLEGSGFWLFPKVI